jgi:hypothetical protein
MFVIGSYFLFYFACLLFLRMESMIFARLKNNAATATPVTARKNDINAIA